MSTDVVLANYGSEQHERDIIYLLNCYALDPMGGGEPLSSHVQANLVKELSKISHAFSILCYVDEKPAGLINCFEGFSSFLCKPLINVHDVVVLESFRGQGLCPLMLAKVEEIALHRGCSKITLEVLEGNSAAKKSYSSFGFAGYSLDPEFGQALFWQKSL
ncbi:MAG: GNAT family N-acetyltransferase [Pseudomonadales bacterium]